MDDRKADPKAQKSMNKDTPQPDSTDYGQAAGSPGGRGGTTCYGGIQRVEPRKPMQETPSRTG